MIKQQVSQSSMIMTEPLGTLKILVNFFHSVCDGKRLFLDNECIHFFFAEGELKKVEKVKLKNSN